ncbi:MAG TPA: prepilin peptidase [Acidobacteriota bacterium]|nr:prepilin peptidase [Acidobacteriota bacterium]
MAIIDVLVILFGLLMGSFLNVCIYRVPKGRSVVFPSSACPKCGAAIRPWFNVPLIGYLLLRGRCSKCKEPISGVYPLVEILTAGLFYAAYLKFDLDPPFYLALVFFALLVVLTFIDLFDRLLPDVFTLGGALFGLLLAPLQAEVYFRGDPFLPAPEGIFVPYLHSLLGIFLGGGVLWLVAWLYQTLRKIEGMGFGDIKMMAMVGAFLGWRYAWFTIFLGSLMGAVIGTLYIYIRGKGRRYELPFGTFLAAAAVLTALWGPQWLAWYLDLVSPPAQ